MYGNLAPSEHGNSMLSQVYIHVASVMDACMVATTGVCESLASHWDNGEGQAS